MTPDTMPDVTPDTMPDVAPGPAPGVLYVIGCGAPPVRQIDTLVTLAQADRWDVCVILTPMATRFVEDLAALETLTGHPVRSHYKDPGTPDVLPAPDAMIVAPATCNTINKWAEGISDTLALGLVTEGIGKQLPLVALPFTNRAQAAHPAFGRHIDELRSWGVAVLYGDDVYPLHEPGTGSDYLHAYPWHLPVHTLRSRTTGPHHAEESARDARRLAHRTTSSADRAADTCAGGDAAPDRVRAEPCCHDQR